MPKRHRFSAPIVALCALLALSAALLPVVVAQAQSTDPALATPDDLSQSAVESRLAQLDTATGLDEADRNDAAEFYRSALDQIRRAGDSAKQATEYRRLTDEAPQLLVSIRAELAKAPADPTITVPEGATLPQLEQSLSQASADLQAARQNVTELLAETNRRNERRAALPEQIARVRQLLADADDPTRTLPQEGEPLALTDARRTSQAAYRLALAREVESLEAEATSYDARRELLPARRDRAQRRVADSEKLVAAWQTVVTQKRQTEAQQAAREAQRLRREAARQDPVLKQYADATAQMAALRTGSASAADRIDTASRQAAETRSKLATLRAQFASIDRRLSASGLNRSTGMLLRRQFESLPDEGAIRRSVRESQKSLENTEYQLIELQEDRLDAGDIDSVARSLLEAIPEAEGQDRGEIEQVARELATARRELLDKRIADATTYFEKLVDLNSAQRDLLEAEEQYRQFIEERILWVRSVAGDRLPRLDDFRDGVAWLLDGEDWGRALANVRAEAKRRWLLTSTILVVVLATWAAGVPFRRRLRALGDLVSKFVTDSFRHTLMALLLTVLLSAPLALAMYAVGTLLTLPEDQPVVAASVGVGLRHAALVLLPLMLLHQTLRHKGLAEAHFRWSKTAIAPIRRHLRWFTPIVIPTAMLVTALDSGGDEAANASLGRALYTVELVALAVFLHRVLRPKGPVLQRFVEENKGGWIDRLRMLWHPLAVLAPVFIATLSWLGFHYTALQLETRLEQSLSLALVLVLANGVMHRWLLIARRRLAVEDARRRREQANMEAEARREAGEPGVEPVPAIDEDKLDLPGLSSQTRQLFRAAITVAVVAGLFMIWAEALPALRMLDRVQLWPSIRIVDPGLSESAAHAAGAPEGGAAPAEAAPSGVTPLLPLQPGASSATPAPSGEPALAEAPGHTITLADIGFAIVVLLATWVAFRNIPGLVEIIVLQRLPVDAGSRYALSTVLRYCIAIIGVMLAFNALGLSWNKVQWLAAALTFGLAFGLQEIFANFVSGLIILAERPIRLGDTVTVGGTTGTVTRIRMRATTIADWDRKELVIPNKTFITSEVINWSLSDPILRVIVPVGVSYSSDVDQVRTILQKVAAKSAIVLKEPASMVLFRRFGDSTLDFELRVFIPSIDYYQKVIDELHHAIIKAFRKANIEIAFPQRDLHVRTIDGLDAIIQRKPDIPAPENPKG